MNHLQNVPEQDKQIKVAHALHNDIFNYFARLQTKLTSFNHEWPYLIAALTEES